MKLQGLRLRRCQPKIGASVVHDFQPALAAGALPGSYSIEVTNLGAATNTLSKNAQILVTDQQLARPASRTSSSLPTSMSSSEPKAFV